MTTPASAQSMIDRMIQVGTTNGLDFRFDRIRPSNTFDAHRLLVWAGQQSPEIQGKIMSRAMLPDDQTLADLLSEETYADLQKYCDETGVPLPMFERLRPSLLIITLLSLELQKLGINQEGIDMHFYGMGKDDEKSMLLSL